MIDIKSMFTATRITSIVLVSMGLGLGYAQQAQDGGAVTSEFYSVEITVDKDPTGNANPTYTVGEYIYFQARPSQDSYIYIFNIRATGEITRLFPNDVDPDNFVRAQTSRAIPAEGAEYYLQIGGPPGLDKVIAIASLEPLHTNTLLSFTRLDANLDQDALAQSLSIIVTPLTKEAWTTDVALFSIATTSPAAASESAPSDSLSQSGLSANVATDAAADVATSSDDAEARAGTESDITEPTVVSAMPTSARTAPPLPEGPLSQVEATSTGIPAQDTPTLDIPTTPAPQDIALPTPTEIMPNTPQASIGALFIQANVGYADVLIDNIYRGKIEPISGHFTTTNLAPGTYTLRLVAQGYQNAETRFTVKAGVTTRVDLRQERTLPSLP